MRSTILLLSTLAVTHAARSPTFFRRRTYAKLPTVIRMRSRTSCPADYRDSDEDCTRTATLYVNDTIHYEISSDKGCRRPTNIPGMIEICISYHPRIAYFKIRGQPLECMEVRIGWEGWHSHASGHSTHSLWLWGETPCDGHWGDVVPDWRWADGTEWHMEDVPDE